LAWPYQRPPIPAEPELIEVPVGASQKEVRVTRENISGKNPRVIPLNAVSPDALDPLKGKEDRSGTEPLFPSARIGDSL